MKTYSELIIDIQQAAKALEKAQANRDFEAILNAAKDAEHAARDLCIFCMNSLVEEHDEDDS